MNLTRDQKNAFFSSYENLLWKAVHGFKRRCSLYWPNEDDLFQECALVLTLHMNNAETMDQLHKIPLKDMLNAMCKFVLASQAVRLPVRTTDFRTNLEQMTLAADIYSLDEVLQDNRLEDVLSSYDFELFLSQLSPVQSSVVSLKRINYTNREVARTLGVNDSQVTRAISRARHSYQRFARLTEC